MMDQKNRKNILAFSTILLFHLIPFTLHYGAWIWLEFDVGRELLVGARLANGDIIYKDVLYWYGPTAQWLNSFILQLFGISIDLYYFVGLFLSIITSCFIYLTLNLVAEDRILALLSSFFFVAYSFIAPDGSSFVMPYTYSVIWATTSVAAMLYSTVLFMKFGKRRFLLLTALLNGLVITFKLEFILAGVVFSVLILPFLKFISDDETAFTAKEIIEYLTICYATTALIWIIAGSQSGWSTLLRNIWPQDALDATYTGEYGMLIDILRSYSPTILSLSLMSILSMTAILTTGRFIKLPKSKNLYPFLIFILLLGSALIYGFNLTFDFNPFLNNRFFVLINIGGFLLSSYYIFITRKKEYIYLALLVCCFYSLSIYTRHGKVYGIWQFAAFINLGLLLAILRIEVSNVTWFSSERLKSSSYFLLIVLTIMSMTTSLSGINQTTKAVTLSTPGGHLAVAPELAEPIDKAVTYLSAIPEDEVAVGLESGWLNIAVQKYAPVRATQWGYYLQEEIIEDLDSHHVPFVSLVMHKKRGDFGLFPNSDSLRKYLDAVYEIDKTFGGSKGDQIKIEIYRRVDSEQ